MQSNLPSVKVIEEIKKSIDPADIGLKDVNIRPSREGVVISSSCKTGIDRLDEIIKTHDSLKKNFTTKVPKAKLPEIKIVGIEEDIETDSIPQRLIKQNHLDCSEEDLKVKASWKGKHGKTVILQIKKKAYNALLGKTHLNISWTRCRFFDNTFLPRCSNCSVYGHLEKYCSSSDSKCSRCDDDHHYEGCTRPPSCWVCRKHNYESSEDIDTRHAFSSRDSPTYLRRVAEEAELIFLSMCE